MKNKKTTIKDVAKLAGVSIATVSMVLNKKEHPITEEIKNKVFDAAKQLNYHPNVLAKTLIKQSINSIALIVPDITNPFFSQVAKDVNNAAIKRGYSVLLINNDNADNAKDRIISILNSHIVSGALIITRDSNTKEIIKYSPYVKVVLLDEVEDLFSGIISVTSNNYLGGSIVGKKLIEYGHKKVACIVGPKNTKNSENRFDGFNNIYKLNNLEISSKNIFDGNYTFEGGYKLTNNIIKSGCSAVFCLNDLMAYGLMRGLKEQNIEVGKDISVVGYDNLNICDYISPRLTTVDQNFDKVATMATGILIDLIEGTSIKQKNIMIDPKFVKGDSLLNLKGGNNE